MDVKDTGGVLIKVSVFENCAGNTLHVKRFMLPCEKCQLLQSALSLGALMQS